jgi:hypothetical protein
MWVTLNDQQDSAMGKQGRQMASTSPRTFTRFPELPGELQIMVWEDAAANLPVIDIQRFVAGVTLERRKIRRREVFHPLICYTPHQDFKERTAPIRNLLGACKLAEEVALKWIDCLLPISYITKTAAGESITHQALVPYNRSGRFCVSGFKPALQNCMTGSDDTCTSSLGLLQDRNHMATSRYISIKKQTDEETTASLVKNLMITLDSRPSRWHDLAQVNTCFEKMSTIASQLPNLKSVSVLGESALDRRQYFDQAYFDGMYKKITVIPT